MCLRVRAAYVPARAGDLIGLGAPKFTFQLGCLITLGSAPNQTMARISRIRYKLWLGSVPPRMLAFPHHRSPDGICSSNLPLTPAAERPRITPAPIMWLVTHGIP